MNKKIAFFALALVIAGSAGAYSWSRGHSTGSDVKTVTTLNAVYGKTTPEELFKLTDGIVIGTVEDLQVAKVPSRVIEGKQNIVTNATIKVEKFLANPKNVATPTITVQTVGGTLGNEATVSDDFPTFEKGQRVIVFLHQEPDGIFTIFRWSQGLFTVNADGKVATEGKEAAFFRNVFGKDMALSELETQIAAASTK